MLRLTGTVTAWEAAEGCIQTLIQAWVTRQQIMGGMLAQENHTVLKDRHFPKTALLHKNSVITHGLMFEELQISSVPNLYQIFSSSFPSKLSPNFCFKVLDRGKIL